MTVDVVHDTIDLAAYVPTAINEEAKRLLKLYWIVDNWMDDVESIELQRIHAQVLRSQLNRLVHYYFDGGQRNKAKLAVTLCGATLYAEKAGLGQKQIATIQKLFRYFQRIDLTVDELSQCHRSLLDNDIYTLPDMPNWQVAIADH